MSKFAQQTPQPVHPIGTMHQAPGLSGVPAFTHEGGLGEQRDVLSELYLLGVSNMVTERTLYESGRERDDRFTQLIHAATAINPEWVAAFVPHLRSVMNMRTASLVTAAEYVAAGGPNGRAVVASALQRPDEPAELIAYWRLTHKRSLPKPIKRGIADALPRLYTERNSLRYDGTANKYRFADIIQTVHGRPENAKQSHAWKYLLDARYNDDAETPIGLLREDRYLQSLPEGERRGALSLATGAGWSWERLAGWLPDGMDAQAWEAAIPNMGYMALLRNLRNFDEAGISAQAVQTVMNRLRDPAEVARSKQFPIRFLSAWRELGSLKWAGVLEEAIEHSLVNIPSLSGRTLVMLDVSPSMAWAISGHGKRKRFEVAAMFGYALAKRAENARVVAYSGYSVYQNQWGYGWGDGWDHGARPKTVLLAEDVTERVRRPVLTSIDLTEADVAKGNGTETWETLRRFYQGEDRVIILTDEQTRGSAEGTNHIPTIYTFNVGGDGPAHVRSGRDGRYTFGGLTDAAFKVIPLLERGRSVGWDKVLTAP